MSGRGKTVVYLVTVGCIVLLGGAALHLLAAYPRVSSGVTASNLSAALQSASRTVFLLVGWDWIVFAVVVLSATFNARKLRKTILLVCGFALLVQTAAMLAFLGWFIGTVIILVSALLIVCGGFLFDSAAQAGA